MAKANLKSYFEPTPKLFRKMGLAIASLGNTIGATFGVSGYVATDMEQGKHLMAIGVASCILGWLGKEMTNFFQEDTDVQQP
jgi:hypothetical protein